MTSSGTFRRCSSCRKPIGFEARYYRCSVSTCNRAKTALFFCSVDCWEAHRATANHRDAWAEEATSPNEADWRKELEAAAFKEQAAEKAKKRRAVSGKSAARPVSLKRAPTEVLIVVSKLKTFVKDRADMNTSDGVFGVLSEHLRELTDDAIQVAGVDGRQTVMARDYADGLARHASRAVGDDAPAETGGDVLVVTSRLKAYIKARGKMSTSGDVLVPLSDHLRQLCRLAIQNAGSDDRRTVMDRDFVKAIG